LVIISYTTGLSFAEERIGPLAAIVTIVFYLLALYLFVLSNTPENPFASIYSETLIKTTIQHLLLLVGFDTLIYRKYYDTPPILVGHHCPTVICLPSMLLFILWRDTTSELWTLVQFPLHCYTVLLLLTLFTFLHTTITFHSIRSYHCL
jgi:hypothetical protein